MCLELQTLKQSAVSGGGLMVRELQTFRHGPVSAGGLTVSRVHLNISPFAVFSGNRPKKARIFVAQQILASENAVSVKSSSPRPGVCENASERSFTVYYLMNSCGLSSEEAISASHKVQFKSPENADAVLELLREYGFTDAQILKMVITYPKILAFCPSENLLPKLEFFRSVGVPLPALAHTLSRYPCLLWRSLEKKIIPSYNLLKALLKTDERAYRALFRAPRAFDISRNISVLRGRGVPESSIAALLCSPTSLLAISKDKLAAHVDRALKMGFDPSKAVFRHAVLVFVGMNESSLKRKMDVYRRCGWSDSDFMTAFLKHPVCTTYSEKKIVENMDFLVNEHGLTPADIAERPGLLGYSLENRIKPRVLVARFLDRKGLKNMVTVATLVSYSEEEFLDRYIFKYVEDFPSLLDMYEGKLNPDDCVSVDKSKLTEVNAESRA